MANSICDPVIISNDSIVSTLKRINFAGKEISEKWIQDLIQKQPSVLPANYFDSNYYNLISIGYEVGLEDGNIDNLLVTPQGSIVVVETKLWRNPEARRQVIAQIIDYAKLLTAWEFQDFDQVAHEYSKSFLDKEMGISDLIKQSCPDYDEKEFHDNLIRNAGQGKILLLIVGDGIRENTEQLVEFLQQFANIHFTIGLVELKLYQIDDSQRLVIPDILFKTKEILRGVISIEGVSTKRVNLTIDNSIEINSQIKKNKNLTSEEYFRLLKENVGEEEVLFAQKVLSDFSAKGYAFNWNTTSFTIRAYDKNTKKKATLVGLTYKGELWYWYSDFLTNDQNLDFGNSIALLYPGIDPKNGFWPFMELTKDNKYKTFVEIIEKYTELVQQEMQKEK